MGCLFELVNSPTFRSRFIKYLICEFSFYHKMISGQRKRSMTVKFYVRMYPSTDVYIFPWNVINNSRYKMTMLNLLFYYSRYSFLIFRFFFFSTVMKFSIITALSRQTNFFHFNFFWFYSYLIFEHKEPDDMNYDTGGFCTTKIYTLLTTRNHAYNKNSDIYSSTHAINISHNWTLKYLHNKSFAEPAA